MLRVEAEPTRDDPLRVDAEALREDLPCVEAEAPREDLLRPEAEAPLRDDRPRAELALRLRDAPVRRPLADLLLELLPEDELPLDELPFAALLDLLLPALLLEALLPEALLPEDDARALREREDDGRELLRALLLDRCAMDILLPYFCAMRTRTLQDANALEYCRHIPSRLCRSAARPELMALPQKPDG